MKAKIDAANAIAINMIANGQTKTFLKTFVLKKMFVTEEMFYAIHYKSYHFLFAEIFRFADTVSNEVPALFLKLGYSQEEIDDTLIYYGFSKLASKEGLFSHRLFFELVEQKEFGFLLEKVKKVDAEEEQKIIWAYIDKYASEIFLKNNHRLEELIRRRCWQYVPFSEISYKILLEDRHYSRLLANLALLDIKEAREVVQVILDIPVGGLSIVRTFAPLNALVYCGRKDLVIEQKGWEWWFTAHYPKSYSDWEGWLNEAKKKAVVFKVAANNKNWLFLFKHKKRWMLFVNRQFKLWFKSFAY